MIDDLIEWHIMHLYYVAMRMFSVLLIVQNLFIFKCLC